MADVENKTGEQAQPISTTATAIAEATPAQAQPTSTETPTVNTVNAGQTEKTPAPNPATENQQSGTEQGQTATNETSTTEQPKKGELTNEQFIAYNDSLRQVSKQAQSGVAHYNAFTDNEVKTQIKEAVIAGKTPDIKSIAEAVIAKHKPADTGTISTQAQASDERTKRLEAENALLKAGIRADRAEEATELFIKQGFTADKANEFIGKYPEWNQQISSVTVGKTVSVVGNTAPTPTNEIPQSDLIKEINRQREAKGLKPI